MSAFEVPAWKCTLLACQRYPVRFSMLMVIVRLILPSNFVSVDKCSKPTEIQQQYITGFSKRTQSVNSNCKGKQKIVRVNLAGLVLIINKIFQQGAHVTICGFQ